MSITFKILLSTRRANPQQQYPVILRVYKGTYYKEQSLNIKVVETDWDAANQKVLSSCTDHEAYNTKILSVRSKVHKQILLEELNEANDVLPEDIIAAISAPKESKIRVGKPCIIKYGQALIKQLTDSGKVGNAFTYGCAVNKLKSFVGDSFAFEDLTYKKLNEFQDSMLADEIKVNSISVYMRSIRAIYNRAIKEGIVPATAYPFTAFRIKNEKTPSRTLSIAEFRKIVSLDVPVNSPTWHWRNYFMLSFCLIGINFADLLTLSGENLVDGRIVFRRKKTGKIYSIQLHERALSILSHYADIKRMKKGQLLLPVLIPTSDMVKRKKDIWQAIKTCNAYLDRIAKDLKFSKEITTYYARYTWANIARSLGYSKDIIGQGLGHSYGNATTSIYLDDYDNKIIDAANKKVITAAFK